MNSQLFDPSTESGRKHFQALLDILLDYNIDPKQPSFNDIHIYQEDSFIGIEWTTINYEHSAEEGRFQYVDCDEVVMKDVRFPDDTYEYLLPNEVEERMKEWHKDHPEWVETPYGTWTNVEENRCFAIELHTAEWSQRKVQENDSTFSTQVLDLKELQENSFLDIIAKAPGDVLYRTDYIVIGPSETLYKLCDRQFSQQEKNNSNGIKLGEIELSYSYKLLREPQSFIGKYPIYKAEEYFWTGNPNKIIFVTATNYLIYSIEGCEKNAK